MRHKGFTLVEGLILFAVILVIAAVLFPIFAPSRDLRRPSCQSPLKQIGLGFLQYAQDYDEKFPHVALAPVADTQKGKSYGWADALQPYIKYTQIYQCPDEQSKTMSGVPTQTGYTDYWMNLNLSFVALEKIKKPQDTILSGDGNDGSDLTNARYNINALPKPWIDDTNSPAYRHDGKANYLFADGHVKAFEPEKIQNTSISNSGPTFAIK